MFFFWHLISGPTELSVISAFTDLLTGNASTDALILCGNSPAQGLARNLYWYLISAFWCSLAGLVNKPFGQSLTLLGVSQSGVLVAVLVLYYGLASLSWFIVPLAAMSGALIAVAFIFSLAGKYQGALDDYTHWHSH